MSANLTIVAGGPCGPRAPGVPVTRPRRCSCACTVDAVRGGGASGHGRESDSITTTCTYDTTSVTTVTKGGEASTNEMCFGFLFYYPRLTTTTGADIDACNA